MTAIQVVVLIGALACVVVPICVPSLPSAAGRWSMVVALTLAAVAVLAPRRPR